ncbi:hypothetical protein CEXT_647881 [Caerostris extrusa]|uniref:Secreted protein n=1 Tax=Caerostris extrusa TaxID=172846 RepID=A0AAV4RSK5_CAEEX|nr:hypothetical protein CEXT_647881 [Caerostris extrusa]
MLPGSPFLLIQFILFIITSALHHPYYLHTDFIHKLITSFNWFLLPNFTISTTTCCHLLYPSPSTPLSPAPLNEVFQELHPSSSSTQYPAAPSLFTLWNFYD